MHNIQMGSARFLFATSVLLLSLLVIVTVNDYGSAPKPDYNTPKPEGNYNPDLPITPDYEKPKPEGNYKPDLPKIPDYEKPNLPEGKDELLPTIFGIQRLVLCKSGSQNFPLKGAVARITCVMKMAGYETAPFSILSNGCDGNGYFFATLSPYSRLVENKKIILHWILVKF